VIILTGTAPSTSRLQAVKQGADQFLTKPTELATLYVMIQRLLEHQRNRQRHLRSGPAGEETRLIRSWDKFDHTKLAILRTRWSPRQAVLIRAKPGRAKGVLARWFHDHSNARPRHSWT